jgi:pyruvate dehydrogenase E2 component (dihydrolipoamide acetyltransferase)
MAETKEATVPDIGDYSDVPVIEVLVKAGDRVEKDQGLVTLESDKATMEVPAPFAGTVKEVKVKTDDRVSQGTVVAVLEPGDGDAAVAKAAPEKAPDKVSDKSSDKSSDKKSDKAPDKASDKAEPDEPSEPAREKPATSADESKSEANRNADAPAPRSPPIEFSAAELMPDKVPYASPAIRVLARELGVDLAKVTGSGRKGRIIKEDVQAFVKKALSGAAPAASNAGGLNLIPWPKVDFTKFGEVRAEPLSRIKKLSGANLARNWAMIPHVTQQDLADITEMEAFRKQLGAEHKDVKITPLVFLIKAVVAALKAFPNFNASLDETGENLILKQYYNIGIAVDTPDGLTVPVIRDCDKKGLLELAGELSEVSQKARDKKLSPADMSGGCFSISSLGGIGGTGFTPIINAPEVAILGVSRSSMQPVWDGNAFRPRLMLPLSLSYDHRVIDGAAAARFTAYLAAALTDLRRLLL